MKNLVLNFEKRFFDKVTVQMSSIVPNFYILCDIKHVHNIIKIFQSLYNLKCCFFIINLLIYDYNFFTLMSM